MRSATITFLATLLGIAIASAAQAPTGKTLAPAQVTLQGPMTLQDALKTLAATGNPVVDLRSRYGQETANPTLEFSLSKGSFWQAADEIARKANLRLQPFANPESRESALGFVGLSAFGNGTSCPAEYDGPFRMSVKRLTADRHLEDKSLSSLTIATELTWEPRYRPLLLKLGEGSVQAANEAGALTAIDQGGSATIRLLGEAAAELPLRLPLPARSQPTLAQLECRFVIYVPPEQLQFRFPRLAPNEQQSSKGVTALINRFEVEPKSGLWTIGITLMYPRGTVEFESHQTWAVDGNEIFLIGRNGQRIASKLNREVSIEDGGAMKVTYYFERTGGAPQDYRLEYRAPATPLPCPAKFTFHNLPLP